MVDIWKGSVAVLLRWEGGSRNFARPEAQGPKARGYPFLVKEDMATDGSAQVTLPVSLGDAPQAQTPLAYGQVTLPVSLGEALDKLTILDIKLQKIQDERRADVQKEYDALFSILQTYVERFSYHYRILREINQTLWDVQDQFHGKDVTPDRGAQIARDILLENDRRFRVKLKVNQLANSVLKEQKGYALKKALIYTHLGLGDMYWMNGAVRYLATAYDEVHVICKRKYGHNASLMYADDPSIKLLLIEDDIDLHPWSGKRSWFEGQGYTVYGCGFFSAKPHGARAIYNLPISFYDDLAIPREVRTTYFHVPRTRESISLAAEVGRLTAGRPYTVIHQQSSVQTLAIYEKVRAAKGPDTLILDLNENHYAPDHPDWALAELVVNKPLTDYTALLEGAHALHMIESSIYCLASHLDLRAGQERVCYEPWGGNAERLGVFTTGKAEKVVPTPRPKA